MKHRGKAGYRILCLFIAAVLLFAQFSISPVKAEEKEVVYIRDAEGFYRLSEQCRTESFSTGKTFMLESDLDLSAYENLVVPIMDGTFKGNGHSVTGVRLTEEVSDYGLFRYVGVNGTVQDLTVEAQVVSDEEQENIGIIAGNNAGTIKNCVSLGSIDGTKCVGGIAGLNEETGHILSSRNEAKVDGKNAVGGISGKNKGEISKCTNAGTVNTSQKVLKAMDGESSISICGL